MAPGAWTVHGGEVQLFTEGETANAGLEGIAEDGANELTVTDLAATTGYTSPLAPGVWAVHSGDANPIFTDGVADAGNGLEALAEDGDPSGLNATLASATGVNSNGVFNTPVGASGAGPLLPGGMYTFTFDAAEGDYLSLATMLVHSNDLFYGFEDMGISLFSNGSPIQGDITSSIDLRDAGTEVNEYPGAGNNQPARGGGNSGADENGTVRLVNDGFSYPTVADAIRVTIEPMQ